MWTTTGGDPLAWAFGALGVQDRARHLATLYLNDLADVLRDAVDPRFEFVRYAESLAQQPAHASTRWPRRWPRRPTWWTTRCRTLTLEAVQRHQPTVVLLSVPFPGAVYAAFRIAQTIKAHDPAHHHRAGRRLRQHRAARAGRAARVRLLRLRDAGRRRAPAAGAAGAPAGPRGAQRLVRTFVREEGAVRYINFAEPDVPFADVGTPTWDGLPLDKYLSLLDMLNPMHRLWSDGRWNKLTVAHGCYWKKCSFCDVSLDYISRYDARQATTLVRPHRQPSWPRPGRPAFTSSTKPRRPRR
jgi:hypothetical protein